MSVSPLATVELLLSAGVDPNTAGEFGRTPLWRACFMVWRCRLTLSNPR
jgi:hypothetical protein